MWKLLNNRNKEKTHETTNFSAISSELLGSIQYIWHRAQRDKKKIKIQKAEETDPHSHEVWKLGKAKGKWWKLDFAGSHWASTRGFNWGESWEFYFNKLPSSQGFWSVTEWPTRSLSIILIKTPLIKYDNWLTFLKSNIAFYNVVSY
jgi:hypothetical protein